MTETTKRACVEALGWLKEHGLFERAVEAGPQETAKRLRNSLFTCLNSPGLPGTREEVLVTIEELNNGEADQFLAGLLGYY